jgi:hypothetical protein
MRFAGDLFSAFRPGGEAIMGADREARGFIKKNPWSLGAVGYGLKATGALDQPAPGLRGLDAIGGLARQPESKSPFPIGGLVGGLFG